MGPWLSAVYISLCLVEATVSVPSAYRPEPQAPVFEEVDPVYLYESMVKSLSEYEAARTAAELGSRRDGDDHVCYGELGCFFKNGTYGNFWILPAPPAQIKTRFLLYGSSSLDYPEAIDYSDPAALRQSSFRPDLPTTFLVPGFGNSPTDSWVVEFRQAVFHAVPQGNYILVDWTEGAKPPNYWWASANTQVVGVQIAKLIEALNTHLSSRSESFHIIGYSLGAHVAGVAGHRLMEFGQKRLGKITALDPAGPVFENAHEHASLNPNDADFVAAIHANGATLSEGGFGLHRRVGHIDFYPNGGRYQPGCPHAIWGAIGNLLTFNFGSLPDSIKCNHHRALLLVLEALEPTCSHHSYACKSWESFKDGHCDSTPDGNMLVFGTNQASEHPHYLVTKDATGFCANPVKVTAEIAPDSPKAAGNLLVALVGQDGTQETQERLAEKEDFPVGKPVVEVLPSRLAVQSIKQVKLRYEPDCGGWFSSCKRLQLSNLTLEDFANGRIRRCGGPVSVLKGEDVVVDLRECP